MRRPGPERLCRAHQPAAARAGGVRRCRRIATLSPRRTAPRPHSAARAAGRRAPISSSAGVHRAGSREPSGTPGPASPNLETRRSAGGEREIRHFCIRTTTTTTTTAAVKERVNAVTARADYLNSIRDVVPIEGDGPWGGIRRRENDNRVRRMRTRHAPYPKREIRKSEHGDERHRRAFVQKPTAPVQGRTLSSNS